MQTVSIFKNGNNRAIRLPRDLDFEGVSELEIVREGDSIMKTLSVTKDDLTCEQNVYAGYQYLLIHHA